MSFVEKYFPDIEAIEITVSQGDIMSWPTKSEILDAPVTFDRDSLPEAISCNNRRCSDGGLRLYEVVREMVSASETHLNKSIKCEGHTGGRQRRGQSCHYAFTAEIHIAYKTKEASLA